MSDRFRTPLAFLIAAALVAGPAAPAVAQSSDEPTKEELKRAGEHFQNGAENYAAGDYSKAIVDFLKAYNEVPNALFLYNISLSYGKLGNVEDALAAARKAGAGEGMDDHTTNRNQARIMAYERWTSAARVAGHIETARARAEAEKKKQQQQAQQHDTGSAKGSTFGGLGWIGAGLMVAGGGLSVGSAIVANGLKQPIEDYKQAGESGDAQSYDTLKSEIRSDQSLGKVLLFAGTGTAAVGLVLLLVDLGNGAGENETAVFFSPTADGAMAGLRKRF